MLLKLNKLRNKANAINAIYLIGEKNYNHVTVDDVIRFPFDKIMIDLELYDQNDSSAQFSIPEMKRFEHKNSKMNTKKVFNGFA